MTGTIERAWREERPRIVGALARRFGDLELAEDAVQEAFAAAAIHWPATGEPDRPGAWLTTTAQRKAIGMIRKRRPEPVMSGADSEPAGDDGAGEPAPVSDDDLFALLLTCCHPALDPEARIALTLRHVCGLGTDQIAAGFVVGEAAMAKRLVRARAKIRLAGIAFGVPDAAALDQRVDDVRTVIYLVFNEGYLATGDGHDTIRVGLCEEAIWLARHLHTLRPDDESAGLLALVLTQHARRDARQSETGALVPFDEQDRSRWDHEAIDGARATLSATSGRTLGRYQVEAAIALLHVATGGPDWARIADLYGVLGRLAPSPVAEVNRALAVGRADGPLAGLAVLEPILAGSRLDGYAPLHSVHAQLLDDAGDPVAARAAWLRAAATAGNPDARRAFSERAGVGSAPLDA